MEVVYTFLEKSMNYQVIGLLNNFQIGLSEKDNQQSIKDGHLNNIVALPAA